ncbi:hypothetical protein BH11PSE13_BH11PSE13_36450 [soil metagenome]
MAERYGRSAVALLMAVVMTMAAVCAAPSAAWASEATPLADDPALEARVKSIAEELRCLVCQNETIAASQSALANDLRHQITEQLSEGRSPEEVREFMTSRYGQFVLYRPLFNMTNALLWIGPFALLATGLGVLWATLRRRRHGSESGHWNGAAPAGLAPSAGASETLTALGMTEVERRRLRALLEGQSR